MKLYRICPLCGAALDPDEKCDCKQGYDKNDKSKKKEERTNNICTFIKSNGKGCSKDFTDIRTNDL